MEGRHQCQVQELLKLTYRCGSPTTDPWRATGFYGQIDLGKRHISWQLLEALRA